MEVRILANLAGSEKLSQLFQGEGTNSSSKGDIYVFMASKLFSKDVLDVTKADRSCAKQITLGVIYGMGVNTLHTWLLWILISKYLHFFTFQVTLLAQKLTTATKRTVSYASAKTQHDNWFKLFPKVREFNNKASLQLELNQF